jgi:hypothetical protein
MKTWITSLLALLLTSCASVSQDVDLIYSDTRLRIPGGYTIIGSKDLGGDMLAFRYGEVRGKDYIAISDKTDDASIDYGCRPAEFYNELFSPSDSTKCHTKELEVLREELLGDGLIKIWKAPGTTINYLDTKKDTGSFIFICYDNGKTIEINSDILAEGDYQKMLGELLNAPQAEQIK